VLGQARSKTGLFQAISKTGLFQARSKTGLLSQFLFVLWFFFLIKSQVLRNII